MVAWAQGHLHQAVLYAIVSRKHQKWYLGKHEQIRHVNNKEVDGHPERRGEHVEGMLAPNSARNKGAKYRLWKPYDVWDQCMIPLCGDTSDRICKVEDYGIVVDQPPANRRGKRMYYENQGRRKELDAMMREHRPPRWKRK